VTAKPIVLKVLLQHRHLQTRRAFCREYDRVAADIDPTLRGGWPSKAQFYRWLAGDLVGIPYADHCRVLEKMFPGCTVDQLFQINDDGIGFVPEPSNAQPTTPSPSRSATPQPVPARRSHLPEADQLKEARITNLWPRTNPAVLDDLVARVNNAREEITVFGLPATFTLKTICYLCLRRRLSIYR
jgi:hypothetical protein